MINLLAIFSFTIIWFNFSVIKSKEQKRNILFCLCQFGSHNQISTYSKCLITAPISGKNESLSRTKSSYTRQLPHIFWIFKDFTQCGCQIIIFRQITHPQWYRVLRYIFNIHPRRITQIPLLIRHCAGRKNLPIPRLTCLLVTISSSWSLFSFLVALPVKIICILIIMTRLHKSILDQSVYHDKCSKRTLLVD